MTDRLAAEAFPPGEYLKDELDARGWTQTEFAAIIGRPVAVVNQILTGRRGITAETANVIGAALGTSAMYWMNLDAAYRLWKAGPASPRIEKAARVREAFPVREMIKRGWLEPSENPDVLEQRVFKYFDIGAIDEKPTFAHAAKKTGYPADLTGLQLAWLFRVRQIAEAMPSRPFSVGGLTEAIDTLETMLVNVEDIGRVPKILADCGVRFVVVEHIPGSKIDGVCFWLPGKANRPVVGLSLRLDRIDNFWFVLRHELEHVLRGHGREEAIVDREADVKPDATLPKEEKIANAAAQAFCVPRSDWDDFILRTKPLYSESKVVNFANRIHRHPALVIGQLMWHTDNYARFRSYLVPIREALTAVAMTDGYGHSIPLTTA